MLFYLTTDSRSMAVKIGFRLVSLLFENNLPAVVVTPSGRAPQWFTEAVPVITRAEAADRISSGDRLVTGRAGDFPLFDSPKVRRIFHCVLERDIPGEIGDNSQYEVWTSSGGMRDRLAVGGGRRIKNIGMHVHRSFFYDGREKVLDRVCCNARQFDGANEAWLEQADGRELILMDSFDESDLANRLKSASFYLSPATGPGAELAEIEAMAAGCIVVRTANVRCAGHVPDGHNCVYATLDGLRCTLDSLAGNARRLRRESLQHAAIATAVVYTRQAHSRWLQRHVLADLVSVSA